MIDHDVSCGCTLCLAAREGEAVPSDQPHAGVREVTWLMNQVARNNDPEHSALLAVERAARELWDCASPNNNISKKKARANFKHALAELDRVRGVKS